MRGNNDREGPESLFPEVETLDLGGCRIFLTHIVKVPKEGDQAGLALYINAGADVIVFGHSHIRVDETIEGVRYVQHSLAYPRERREPRPVLKQIV